MDKEFLEFSKRQVWERYQDLQYVLYGFGAVMIAMTSI